MKASIALFSLAVLLSHSVLFGKEASSSGLSSSGAIAWSVNPENGDLNLISAAGRGSPVKLCETLNTANLTVHFSPDDKFVAVADGSSSLGIHVTLYKRSSGLSYTEVDFDLDLATQKLAMDVLHGKKIDEIVLDHSYLKCLGWSKNGQWLALQLSGKGKVDGKWVEISGFKCAYDPVQGAITNNGRLVK